MHEAPPLVLPASVTPQQPPPERLLSYLERGQTDGSSLSCSLRSSIEETKKKVKETKGKGCASHLACIAPKLLSQGERCCVLRVGAADLHDVPKLLGLAQQRHLRSGSSRALPLAVERLVRERALGNPITRVSAAARFMSPSQAAHIGQASLLGQQQLEQRVSVLQRGELTVLKPKRRKHTPTGGEATWSALCMC